MATDIVDGTPPSPTLEIALAPNNNHELPTVVTTNITPHQKYPIRINICLKNCEKDVNPFAVIKALLKEITTHDPSALLGDHGEVFYSLHDFPKTNDDFEAAFHGKPKEEDKTLIKPFFK